MCFGELHLKRMIETEVVKKINLCKKDFFLHSRKVVFGLYDKHTITTNLLIELCHFILSFWGQGDRHIFLSVLNLQFGGAIAF